MDDKIRVQYRLKVGKVYETVETREYTLVELDRHILGIFVHQVLDSSGRIGRIDKVMETAGRFAYYSGGVLNAIQIMKWIVENETMDQRLLVNLLKSRYFNDAERIGTFDHMGEDNFSGLQELREVINKYLNDLEEAEKAVRELWYFGAHPNSFVHEAVTAIEHMEKMRNHALTHHDVENIAAMAYRMGVRAERQRRRTRKAE